MSRGRPREVDGGARSGGSRRSRHRTADANEFWLELTGVQCRSFGCSEAATAGSSGDWRERESERASWKEACVRYLGECCDATLVRLLFLCRGDVVRSF